MGCSHHRTQTSTCKRDNKQIGKQMDILQARDSWGVDEQIFPRVIPCKFMDMCCLAGCRERVKFSDSADICSAPRKAPLLIRFMSALKDKDQTKLKPISSILGKHLPELVRISSLHLLFFFSYCDTILQNSSPGNNFKTFKSFSLLQHLDVKVLCKRSWV